MENRNRIFIHCYIICIHTQDESITAITFIITVMLGGQVGVAEGQSGKDDRFIITKSKKYNNNNLIQIHIFICIHQYQTLLSEMGCGVC